MYVYTHTYYTLRPDMALGSWRRSLEGASVGMNVRVLLILGNGKNFDSNMIEPQEPAEGIWN